jgi:hypothetical protein
LTTADHEQARRPGPDSRAKSTQLGGDANAEAQTWPFLPLFSWCRRITLLTAHLLPNIRETLARIRSQPSIHASFEGG